MKLRNAGLLVAILAAAGACKKSETPTKQQSSGSAAVVAEAHGSADSAEVATGSGASGDPWSKPKSAKDPLPKPLFWSVEKDGKTDYLLGTMHMGIDPESRLPDIVFHKLDESKTFAMETDLSDAGKLDVLRKDGSSLEDELGPEYWKKLEAAIGVQEAARLRGFKPMIPATVLSMRGLPETAPMDGVLQGRALNQKKQIVFLEQIETQGAVLEKWMNARALKEMLDDLPGGEQRSKDMLAAYIAGDEARIEAINNEEKADFLKHGRTQKEYDEQMEDLLFKRNASWIPVIEKIHGGAFIAVGAMHLIGKRSVLDLLGQKGYKVTRLTP
ncbi:MAG TPA: TraB/GumN family protein [Kofleriaceae bacterium]|nr:TraB/GumN family protein [Kofleriaceae bacterium]